MTEENKTSDDLELTFIIHSEDIAAKKVGIRSFIFDRFSRLIAKEPLKVAGKDGLADLKISEIPLRPLVKVDKDITKSKNHSRRKPSSRTLEKKPVRKSKVDLDIVRLG